MIAAISIDELNALDRPAFVARLGGIYEQSPWVAERVWQARPFGDRQALERAMQEVVRRAGREQQLELLRKHPRLGIETGLSGHSRAEQAAAGLSQATRGDRADLEELNDAYEKKFGFPFIVAVRGLDMAQIIDRARMRIKNDPAAEFDESLRQVFIIAGYRLDQSLRRP